MPDFRLFAFFLATLITMTVPVRGQETPATYLSDPALFHEAWGALRVEFGDAEILSIDIKDMRIDAQVHAPGGAAHIDTWVVRREDRLLGGWTDVVSGPRPMNNTTPLADPSSGFFKQSDIGLDRIASVMAAALNEVVLAAPGQVTSVHIARRLDFASRLAHGDVRWRIRVANRNEWASVQALADGTILGADISHTIRGQNRNFLAQDDWAFGRVAAGFTQLVGTGDVVHEIQVLWHGIEVTSVSQAREDRTSAFRWNGGMFTKSLSASPLVQSPLAGQNQPFALAAANLDRLPAILAGARASVPAACDTVERANAIKTPLTGGEGQLLWIVRIETSARAGDYCVIQLRPDASVFHVALPDALREKGGYLTPTGAVQAIAEFQAVLGADALAYELALREDRASLLAQDPDDPGSLLNLILGKGGITRSMGRPKIMESDADQFTLSRAAQMHPQLLGEAKATVLRAYKTPNAEVYSVKIWSGTPFYPLRTGTPYLRMNLGVPGQQSQSAYVVFTIDGEYIEAMR